MRPTRRRDTPDEENSDWRAVCGKTASTVRRTGRAKALPDPYRRGGDVSGYDFLSRRRGITRRGAQMRVRDLERLGILHRVHYAKGQEWMIAPRLAWLC